MTTYTLGSDNNRAGESGERFMQRALEESGITSYYRTFFGLGVLGMSNDVDWAILNGSYMLYGDTKKQRIAGHRHYTKAGQLFNGGDFRHSTQPSQGMQAAVDRTRGALPDAKVEAMIVFTPSNGRPDESIDVREARWPDRQSTCRRCESTRHSCRCSR